MTANKTCFLSLILLGLSSCSLSRTFHNPQKMPHSIDRYTSFNIGKDTSYIKYDKKKREINFLGADGKLINKKFTITDTFFLGATGNKINGWILSPKKVKPRATILHFHGSASNLMMHYRAISPLVEYGFQVFTFDYSGYGFSEGKSTRENVLKDAHSALDFASVNFKKENNKLIIYGQSYGGYLAAIVGSNRQEDIDGMVIEGSFSAHKAQANHKVPILGMLVKNEAIAAEEIQKNKKPLLLIHSIEDKKVPLKFGKNIFENANEPKEFYKIEKAHLLGLQHYPEEISNKIKFMLNVN